NYQLHAVLMRKPRYAAFYAPGHASGALEVTREIVRAFAAEAVNRGQSPVATLIPTCADLKFFNANRSFPYAPLKAMIVADKISLIDFGEEIIERIHSSRPEAL